MKVYDTDDSAQGDALLARLEEDDLLGKNLISTFGPDTLEEAGNRGFSAIAQ